MTRRSFALLFIVCLPAVAAAQAPAEAPPKPGPTIQFGGYIQYDFLAPLGDGAHAPDTFRFRRVRLQASGEPVREIAWAVSVEVTGTPMLRDAYIALKYVPGATVRIGQLVMPFGREQYLFSSNTLAFTERVSTEVVASRDAGLVVSNDRPLFGWLSYAAALANGTRQNAADNNSAKDGIFRLAASIPRVPGLEVGGSLMRGTQPEGARQRAGADISFERRLFHVAAEYAREQTEGQPEKRAGYVFGAWRIYPRHPSPWFHHLELAARRARTRHLTTSVDQWDVSANYYISQNLRFLFDFIVYADRPDAGAPATFHARANVRF